MAARKFEISLEQHRGLSAIVRLGAVLTAVSALALAASSAAFARATGEPCPAWTQPPPVASPATAKAAGRSKPGTVAGARARAGTAASGSVVYASKGVAVGPTKLLVRATISPLSGSLAVIEYGRGDALTTCGPVERLGQSSGVANVLLSGLQPSTTYRFRLVAKTPAGPVLGPERTFSTLPGGHVPQGVVVGTVSLGGLSRTEARAALLRPISSPLRLTYAGAHWQASRVKAGAVLDARHAVSTALTANPGAKLPSAKLSVDRARLNAFVASLNRRWTRTAQAAGVRLVGKHAVVTTSKAGVEVDTRAMTALLARELATGGTAAVPLATRKTASAPGPATQQKAVVVRLGAQTLTAYLNGKPVLEAPVTTGRAALPTPVGSYFVHYRASPYTFISPWPPGSPYYYPPAHVTWAMYFFDNDFLHDDPAEPTSSFGTGSEDGPYASHGCVHVPRDTMAYLYNWLPVGAPVIVSQT